MMMIIILLMYGKINYSFSSLLFSVKWSCDHCIVLEGSSFDPVGSHVHARQDIRPRPETRTRIRSINYSAANFGWLLLSLRRIAIYEETTPCTECPPHNSQLSTCVIQLCSALWLTHFPRVLSLLLLYAVVTGFTLNWTLKFSKSTGFRTCFTCSSLRVRQIDLCISSVVDLSLFFDWMLNFNYTRAPTSSISSWVYNIRATC
jgi:hypothetical protein